MSSCDDIGRLADELDAIAAGLTGDQDVTATIADATLAKLLRSAIAIYSRLAAEPAGALAEGELRVGITTTEACTACAALLRSQQLTPFEFSVWFSASGGTRESI